MKTSTFLVCLLALLAVGTLARAQAPAAKAAAAPPALITAKMETPAAHTEALKLRLDHNPVTNALTVRTDANGPTRIEVNGTDGRPVITRDVLLGGESSVVLNVANLPRGAYIVTCVAGERRGMKRVILGQ
ncbi:T9SS type A sorting domain-containing protein [Hymenobacter actinosclerus]|uniref:Por secretion system C-terminal sorting domain-containing protein n=1 Tax=Hymenobacter actinosclerus TaxID=82805 RepID=A0A1H9YSY3_9BACT|nr:T9SS type A sorting domain-containing protein [Hymenobacter actinosclerus]SES72172.1 Por secretion system C-terminal sorting domain-containing protein [Hymenobacter actinosclerus]